MHERSAEEQKELDELQAVYPRVPVTLLDRPESRRVDSRVLAEQDPEKYARKNKERQQSYVAAVKKMISSVPPELLHHFR